MSNIRVIDTKASAKAEVVEMAKALLARAEAGEFIDLSYCASNADGSITTGFTPTDDQMRRIAAVSRLNWRFHVVMDEVEG